jgi:SAM-dependent methyltransferase
MVQQSVDTSSLMHNTRKFIKSIIPASIFHRVRDFPYYFIDLVQKNDKTNDTCPPLSLMFDGPRSKEKFKTSGEQALHFYKEVAKISPDSFMLDIGSGIGRKTIPLLSFLSPAAMYVGMDINTTGIDWCLRNITSKNGRFMFFPVNIYNKFYSPNGSIIPNKLVLPFADNSFDVVALWSVFTHMYPDDIAHYLSEIARVLKPGGQLLCSYYLMNEQAQARIKDGSARQAIVHAGDRYWTNNPNIPEDLIAVSDAWLGQEATKVGLAIDSIRYGAWSGNAVDSAIEQMNFQDIVIARKR